MRDPGGGADNQGTLAEEKPFQDLGGIQAFPPGTRVFTSEVKIGRTHSGLNGGEQKSLHRSTRVR